MFLFPKNDWQADFRNNFIWEKLEKYNKSKTKKTKQTELSHFKKLSLNLGLLDACLLEEILTKEGQLSYNNCEFRN